MYTCACSPKYTCACSPTLSKELGSASEKRCLDLHRSALTLSLSLQCLTTSSVVHGEDQVDVWWEAKDKCHNNNQYDRYRTWHAPRTRQDQRRCPAGLFWLWQKSHNWILLEYRISSLMPCYLLGSKLVTQRSELCTLVFEGFYSS